MYKIVRNFFPLLKRLPIHQILNPPLVAAPSLCIRSEMKILKVNAGPLTNFEVYDFLQKKGASLDPAQAIMTKLQQSELKVFEYLAQTPASTQTRESISEFTEKVKEFNLAKAEVVNIINIRPIDPVEAAPCIEDSTERMSDDRLGELQTLIDTVLPPKAEPEVHEEDSNMDAS